MRNMSLKRKMIIFSGIFVSLIVIILIAYLITHLSPKKGSISIKSVPEKVTLKISNGEVVKITEPNQAITLEVGDYTADIEADGFLPVSEKFSVKHNELTIIGAQLTPLTIRAQEEFRSKKYDSTKEFITGQQSVAGGDQLTKDNPILKHLPLYDVYIEIIPCKAYRKQSIASNRIGICITVIDPSNSFYVNQAFDLLKETGEPYDDYDIRINDIAWPNALERSQGAIFAPK